MLSFLYFCIGICPSLPSAFKYLGFVGIVSYLVLAYLILNLIQRYQSFLTRNVRVLFSAFFLFSISLFSIVYPWANARSKIGKGSDRDEALHIGVTRILDGLYPYSHQANTYFDNPISPLPGNLILHIPAQFLFGNTLYTELFLLVISFLLLIWISKRLALFTLAACAVSLEYWQDFLTGGDFASTTLFIFAISLTFLKCYENNQLKLAGVTGFMLGLALSSRITSLVYLFAIFVFLKDRNWTKRILVTIYPLLIFAFVTIPFYLYRPREFSPGVVFGKSAGLSGIFLEIVAITIYISLFNFNHLTSNENWSFFVKFLSPIGFLIAVIPTIMLKDYSLIIYSYTTAILGLIFMLDLKFRDLEKSGI